MATYPYTSGPAALVAAFAQVRKSPPPKIDSAYLQRNNIGRGNESYIISIFKFLGLVDEQGVRVDDKTAFLYVNEEGFRTGLEALLREAYSDVFVDMGDGALDAGRDDLAHWFRTADKTSELVGQRQANTFLTLAAVAGHGELPTARTSTPAKKTSTSEAAKKVPAKKVPPKKDVKQPPAGAGAELPLVTTNQSVGLSVRVEVNLPPGEDAETYDAIFASIKKHLMS